MNETQFQRRGRKGTQSGAETFFSLLVIAAFVLSFAGCSTPPKAGSAADQRAKTFEVKPGKANIYVYRMNQFAGSAIVPEMFLGDLPAGALTRGTCYQWEVPPGPRTVYASIPHQNGAELKVQAEAGRNYFVEFRTHWGSYTANVSLKLKDDAEAKREIGRCVLLHSQLGEVQ